MIMLCVYNIINSLLNNLPQKSNIAALSLTHPEIFDSHVNLHGRMIIMFEAIWKKNQWLGPNKWNSFEFEKYEIHMHVWCIQTLSIIGLGIHHTHI